MHAAAVADEEAQPSRQQACGAAHYLLGCISVILCCAHSREKAPERPAGRYVSCARRLGTATQQREDSCSTEQAAQSRRHRAGIPVTNGIPRHRPGSAERQGTGGTWDMPSCSISLCCIGCTDERACLPAVLPACLPQCCPPGARGGWWRWPLQLWCPYRAPVDNFIVHLASVKVPHAYVWQVGVVCEPVVAHIRQMRRTRTFSCSDLDPRCQSPDRAAAAAAVDWIMGSYTHGSVGIGTQQQPGNAQLCMNKMQAATCTSQSL